MKNLICSKSFFILPLLLILLSCDRDVYYEAAHSIVNNSSKTLHLYGMRLGDTIRNKVIEPESEWVAFQGFIDGQINDPTDFYSAFQGVDSVVIFESNTMQLLETYYDESLFPMKENPEHDLFDKEDHLHEVQEGNKRGEYGFYIFRFVLEDKHFDAK